MFFLFFGRSGHISRFWMYNPSWTYVCIQSSQWLNIQKRPLYPSLTRKNTGTDWGPHLVLWRKIHSSRMSIYSSEQNFSPQNNLWFPAYLEKIKGLIRGHILLVVKSIPHICLYALQNRIFHPKTTSDSPLSSKNKMAGLSSYLASVCKSILCVFLYTVKNRKQKLDVGKQSLRPLDTRRFWGGFRWYRTPKLPLGCTK